MATPKKLPGPAVSMIKTEPGTARSSTSLRLPSFKPPRDLMLGGLPLNQDPKAAARKVYVPNLNLQRKKNLEEPLAKSEPPTSESRRGSGKDRGGRGGRGRGRGRGSGLVQSASEAVFSQGLAKDLTPKRSSGYSERDSSSSSNSKLKIRTESKLFDASESQARLSTLLQDDFIDDPGMCPDTANMPTKLPTLRIKSDQLPKQELRRKVKVEDTNGEVKVKQEPEDAATSLPHFEEQEIFTMTQLFNSTEEHLVLMKLPDWTLQFDSSRDEKSRPSTSKATGEETAPNEEKVTAAPQLMPEGCIGKLQLLKSGRVRLVIGNRVLYTELGVHTAMRQDLISVDADPSAPGGDMINLGPLNARIISSPLYTAQLG